MPRLLAFNADGQGSWSLLHPNLDVDEVTYTRSLQSPTEIQVTTNTERPHLPTLTPWLTGLGVEVEGHLRAFGIITDQDSSDNRLTITAQGLSIYPHQMPWTGAPVHLYNTDPGQIISRIWDHLQSQEWGDLGVQVDNVTTSVRVGIKHPEQTDAEGTITQHEVDEPYILNRAETHDLGDELDSLLAEARLEYREIVSWSSDKPHTHIQIAPRLGARRHDLSAGIGHNVIEIPDVLQEPSDYASHVLAIGAGEGSSRLIGTAQTGTLNRLRRVHIHQAQDLDRQAALNDEAARVLRSKQPRQGTIRSLTLIDHPSLPIYSIQPGDEIRITGDAGQAGPLNRWVRILSLSSSLEEPHIMHAEVIDLL